jgi:hypothetical protein
MSKWNEHMLLCFSTGGTMKKKKFSKKLNLNKKTVSNLVNVEMQEVYGGGLTQRGTPTCQISCIATFCMCLTDEFPC